MKTLIEIIHSLRPQQWIKNLFIFAPLLFSRNLFDLSMGLRVLGAFFLFCLISGASYILNDLMDLEEDKNHPLKRQRPLPSGRLKKKSAFFALVLISVLSLFTALVWNTSFGLVLLLYFLVQIGYSLWLKHIVILDVFLVAAGFALRVIAGGLVISVTISPWLLICTLLLALFLALSKRRHELLLLDDKAAGHRPILSEYSPYLLDQMIAVVTASTVISYCLYTIAAETIAKFGTEHLFATVPFVLYGIFRYLYLIHRRSGGGMPETLILKDKPLLLAIILWVISAALIIYYKV
ncbi:MAG: decaprenyl-phosphate phosphoribosyltransferase [Acidobacteria bacterium]|nr:decaprenyl-phosphate phosphoribosyltransferase [Acidobacteriota bacterium]MCG2814635.1 decaprenyl-phosphate phosphoribosyltransferase [Candidatus Aminicenantes bacterium]MBU1339875.1 decaprenyl-phosphate phosphoribosyltransferase [Acidobacteriota bacterium]MBU1475326.1 decaprenyl-phosphate phosphoribosyltransferase [Acidobacteriota bacterium]MBU4203129.1 decaprenyl-phosphate phosphoribosyltransferase [Acidobacteriota bacterium]